jgi:large subunit ribosomal protein L35
LEGKASTMSKLKTNKALAKRIKVTKNGKLIRHRAGKRHLNSGLSPKRRRQLRGPAAVGQGFEKRIKRALGHAAS